jgi:hypothetical protein
MGSNMRALLPLGAAMLGVMPSRGKKGVSLAAALGLRGDTGSQACPVSKSTLSGAVELSRWRYVVAPVIDVQCLCRARRVCRAFLAGRSERSSSAQSWCDRPSNASSNSGIKPAGVLLSQFHSTTTPAWYFGKKPIIER